MGGSGGVVVGAQGWGGVVQSQNKRWGGVWVKIPETETEPLWLSFGRTV
jgi:hypothetical protein